MYLCFVKWVSFYQRKLPPFVSRREAAIAWSSRSVYRKEKCYVLILFHDNRFENRQVFPGPAGISCQPLLSVASISLETASEPTHHSDKRAIAWLISCVIFAWNPWNCLRQVKCVMQSDCIQIKRFWEGTAHKMRIWHFYSKWKLRQVFSGDKGINAVLNR